MVSENRSKKKKRYADSLFFLVAPFKAFKSFYQKTGFNVDDLKLLKGFQRALAPTGLSSSYIFKK